MKRVAVRPVSEDEFPEFRRLMSEHHQLGCPSMPSRQLRYVAECGGLALALLVFSDGALHLADRERHVGWTPWQLARRRNFVVQNSRFCVLPGPKRPNLASHVLTLAERRLPSDWKAKYGHEPLLLETFVDAARRGSCYFAAGWKEIGVTAGHRRDAAEFMVAGSEPKRILVKELRGGAREMLRAEAMPPELAACELSPSPEAMVRGFGAEALDSLHDSLLDIPDFRRAQARTQPLAGVLCLAVAAMLCGCLTIAEIAAFGRALGQAQMARLRLRRDKRGKTRSSPCAETIWRVLASVDSDALAERVNRWLGGGKAPAAIAIDGKAIKATFGNADGKTMVVNAVSHDGSPLLPGRRCARARDRS